MSANGGTRTLCQRFGCPLTFGHPRLQGIVLVNRVCQLVRQKLEISALLRRHLCVPVAFNLFHASCSSPMLFDRGFISRQRSKWEVGVILRLRDFRKITTHDEKGHVLHMCDGQGETHKRQIACNSHLLTLWCHPPNVSLDKHAGATSRKR